MNKLPDRAKMRRVFLAKKTFAEANAGVTLVFTLGFGILAMLCALYLVINVITRGLPGLDTLPIVGLFLCGVPALYGRRLWLASEEVIKSLPHVPPVSEQIAALPADEVLLRGSNAPAAAPEELLRPAGKQETPAEDLLRASAGNGE